MSFSLPGAHVCVILFYTVYPFVGAEARGWVVDTAGHGSGSILQGLGSWPTVGLFWAPALNLRRMLLTLSCHHVKSVIFNPNFFLTNIYFQNQLFCFQFAL